MGIVVERHSVSIHGSTHYVEKWIDRDIEFLEDRNRGLPFHGDIVQPNGAIKLKLVWKGHDSDLHEHLEDHMWKEEYVELEDLFSV